jgi:hypothetical protein
MDETYAAYFVKDSKKTVSKSGRNMSDIQSIIKCIVWQVGIDLLLQRPGCYLIFSRMVYEECIIWVEKDKIMK